MLCRDVVSGRHELTAASSAPATSTSQSQKRRRGDFAPSIKFADSSCDDVEPTMIGQKLAIDFQRSHRGEDIRAQSSLIR